MSLFGQILGMFTGGGEGGNESTASLPAALLSMLAGQEGGVAGLIQRFQGAGLGETIQSWIGTGTNLPISADSLQKVFGSDTLQQLASHMGIPVDQLTTQVADHLPHLVDGLTPNGEVPPAGHDLLAAGTELLKSRFGIA